MSKDYRICRVEDAEPATDLRAVLRSVLGWTPQPQDGCVRYAALLDKRIVGTVTLCKPAGGDSTAELRSLEVDAAHQTLGCREALLGVALQCARASEYDSLDISVPATSGGRLDFYLANGFRITGSTPGTGGPDLRLSLSLAGLKSSNEVWYPKHHGAWFAAVVPH